MNDYIEKGHASKLSSEQTQTFSPITNYIPHHPVTSVNKPGKIRIVFDAGAKCKGVSLNQNLLKGPDLMNNLIGILMRFRENKYVVMADVKEMFHQIKVKISDCDALRFVWRENPNHPIIDYAMTVHLFGKADSPCIANWILKSQP